MKKIILIVLGLFFMSNVAGGLITVYYGTTFYGGDYLELTFADDGYNMSYLEVGDDYFNIDNCFCNLSGLSATFAVNVSDHDGGSTLLANTTVLRFNVTYTGQVWFNYTGNNTNATYTVHDVTNDNYVLSNENSDTNGTVAFDITFAGATDVRISLDGYFNASTIETVFLYPNGNGYVNDGNIFGDTPSWKCVDEVVSDDNTTYVYFATGGGYVRDAYDITDHTTEAGAISNLTVHIRAVINPSSTRENMGSFVRIGGNTYYVPSSWLDRDTLSTHYRNLSYVYETNPDTGNAWTWDNIDDVQIGAIYQSFTPTKTIKITGIHASVNYTAGPGSIVINTQVAEGVEEENATLVGNLSEDGGHATVTYRFEYGTTTDYGNNTAIAPIAEDETKKVNVSSLLPGTIYHYRIVGWDMYGVKYNGTDETFNTKPYHPTGLAVVVSDDGLYGNLSWVIGAGAAATVLIRNTTGYAADPDVEIEVFNGTGGTYQDYPLDYGVSQYYRAWSYANGVFSDSHSSVSIVNLLAPQPPYNGNSDFHAGTQTVNLSWKRGNASDQEIVVEKQGSFSTSVTDGTEYQNGTNLYFNFTINSSSGYFSVFSWNSTTKLYSTALTIAYGAINISVYNQSQPWQSISPFGILISNADGSEIYQNVTTSPLLIDVHDIPYGDDVIFVINATGYKDTKVTRDVELNYYYTLTFYLAPIETEVDPGGGDPGGSGTNYSTTEHYIVQVIDELNDPVQDAKVVIRFYNNYTGRWDERESFLTDGYGQGTAWLVPGVLYKVNISADGYETLTGQNWIPVYIEYSDDRYKTFQLEFEDIIPQYPDNPYECITHISELSGTTIYVNFTSSCPHLQNVTVYVYEVNLTTNTTTLFGTGTATTNYYTTFTSIDNSCNYIVVYFYNHSYWQNQTATTYIIGSDVRTPLTTIVEVRDLFNPLFGYNPFGWHNFLMWVFLIAGFFYADQRDAGKILVVMGGIILFLNVWVGFSSALVLLAGGVIPVLFIVVGLMVIWNDSRKKGAT